MVSAFFHHLINVSLYSFAIKMLVFDLHSCKNDSSLL
jgi:hypothetical protein